jgi:hypothetical protein
VTTFKPTYGSKTNITITVASLSNSSARASTAVDNSSNLFVDAHVGGFIRANSSGTSSTGYFNIYVYASVDGGTTYSDAATGSDASHTLNNNAFLLGVVELNANSETAEFGPFSIATAFGGIIPMNWGVIVENRSGAALDSTGSNHEVHYRGVQYQSV